MVASADGVERFADTDVAAMVNQVVEARMQHPDGPRAALT
jgi:hypothetical protein